MSLRAALVARRSTRTYETAVTFTQRYGVRRQAVAEHAAILEAALMGACRASGAFDVAFARVDALMREAGVVVDGCVQADAMNSKARCVA